MFVCFAKIQATYQKKKKKKETQLVKKYFTNNPVGPYTLELPLVASVVT